MLFLHSRLKFHHNHVPSSLFADPPGTLNPLNIVSYAVNFHACQFSTSSKLTIRFFLLKLTFVIFKVLFHHNFCNRIFRMMRRLAGKDRSHHGHAVNYARKRGFIEADMPSSIAVCSPCVVPALGACSLITPTCAYTVAYRLQVGRKYSTKTEVKVLTTTNNY